VARHSYASIRPLSSLAVWGSVVAVTLLASCSSPTRPESVPDTHTVEKDGVFHAPGLKDPTQNCTTCHGQSLQGGSNGEPACSTCHGS
jgi:hypothetical protein